MRPIPEIIIDSDAVIGRFCLSVRFHRDPEMKKIAPLPLRVLVLSVLTAAHFVARSPCVADEANALPIVPTDTENTPFEFVVPPGYKEIFLRLNEDPDNEWKENPGKVVYQVTIQKP